VAASGGDLGERFGLDALRREGEDPSAPPSALRFSPRPSPRSGAGGSGPVKGPALADDVPGTVQLTLLRSVVVAALACRIAPLGHAVPDSSDRCVLPSAWVCA
jgi:hypothetical protein